MSAPCQRTFSITVSAGGPPFGPIQLDAGTVAQMNIYSQFLGSSMAYTGLLQYSGGIWYEAQSDAPGYGLVISQFASPALDFVLVSVINGHPFPFDYIQFTSDLLTVGVAFPAGTWKIQGFHPGGFVPNNPAGWADPAGSVAHPNGVPVIATFA